MKDSRFIELLNLYVDREIAPEEAAELEAAVQQSAERRQLYTQYCRMDRGCTVLLSRSPSTPAPRLAAALADAERKVVDYPAQTGGPSKVVLFGGLMAAAAAIAVVLVNRDSVPTPSTNPASTQIQAPVAVVPPASVPTGREATVALTNTPSLVQAGMERANLAWMSQQLSQTTPLSDDDLKLVRRADQPFSAGLTWGLPREHSFPKGGAVRSPSELNAFELSK